MSTTTANAPTASTPSGRLWAGRVLRALLVIFLLFDAISKLARMPAALKTMSQLGFTAPQSVVTGILVLILVALYLTPRTALLGAVLLTGYLGGAAAILVRAASPLPLTLFPLVFGVFIWLGLYLSHPRLGRLLTRAWNQ